MTNEFTDSDIAKISGRSFREQFLEVGKGPWTVIYDAEGINQKTTSAATFSILAPRELRSEFLDSPGWDASIGFGQPGTVAVNDESQSVSYLRYGNERGMEPLVIVTDSAGTRDSEIVINQEFRLAFELFDDKKSGNLIKVLDDGSEEVVVEISNKRVRIRSSYLARYRALRQLDLWLYVDIISHFPQATYDVDLETFRMDWKDECSAGSNAVGTTLGYPTSLFNAKKFLAPGPIEMSNLWEYEDRKVSYEDFIIGEDEFGRSIAFTCEEDKLANYFGKNPDAPHYLTPVFFRKEVLLKYYNHSELYTVTSGSVSCHALWYLRLDNDHEDYVAVFLGDLGRDLPASERRYWKGFNIVPRGPMSTTYSQRSYAGRWVEARQPEHQFKDAYSNLQKRWKTDHGWQIYRDPHQADESILRRLHVPLNDTQSEFEEQLLNLAKLLVDFLNEKALIKAVGKGPSDERGISKLQRFLSETGHEHVKGDISLLREIQELRSKVTAHSKGSDYHKYIEGKLRGATKEDYIRHLLRESTAILQRWTDFSTKYQAYRESLSR